MAAIRTSQLRQPKAWSRLSPRTTEIRDTSNHLRAWAGRAGGFSTCASTALGASKSCFSAGEPSSPIASDRIIERDMLVIAVGGPGMQECCTSPASLPLKNGRAVRSVIHTYDSPGGEKLQKASGNRSESGAPVAPCMQPRKGNGTLEADSCNHWQVWTSAKGERGIVTGTRTGMMSKMPVLVVWGVLLSHLR
jgi:hypothetical protein